MIGHEGGSYLPSASYRPRSGPRGKWATRSTISTGKPKPWRIFCYCCKYDKPVTKDGKEGLMTYEEYTYGIWCTKHRKMFDKNPVKRTSELHSGEEPRKIIFADGYAILDKGKFIELKLQN